MKTVPQAPASYNYTNVTFLTLVAKTKLCTINKWYRTVQSRYTTKITNFLNVIFAQSSLMVIERIKSKKHILQCTLAVLLSTTASAQNNVGIGTTTPNSKAILELKATDKGFIAPRMTTTQMNLIAPTATESALLIYNTDSACYHFYNGTAWKNLCQKQGMDSAAINQLIKNYLNSNATTIINILKGDTALFNYTTINNAVINILTVDTSITNVAIINNATINLLKVDSSVTNYANINNAVIDSSTTNYAYIKELQGGWANLDSLQIGGQNISNIITDSIAAQAWLLKGNAGTNPANNFIGTKDAQDLVFKANNNERMRIAQGTGNVGIGQGLPSQKLDVAGAIKFDRELRPNGLAGNNGEVLTSTGAATAPVWQPVNNIFNSSTSTNINVANIDSSVTNYADINNAVIDSSVTNYANINNAVIDSSITNYANINILKGDSASFNYLTVGGQNIMQTMTDSIASQAWLLKGNAGTNAATNFVGTTDNKSLRFRTNNTEKVIIDSLGNVGIGIVAPVHRLHIEDTNPNNTINTLSLFKPAFTAIPTANYHALWGQLSLNTTFSIPTNIYGSVNRVRLDGSHTGTITGNLVGATADVENYSNATIGSAIGLAGQVYHQGTGSLTNAFASKLAIGKPGTGTITNGYGLFIDNIQATNKWSLYANDATAPSYFAGNVGIGINIPTVKLHVSGIVRAENNSSALQLVGTDHVYSEYYPLTFGAGRKAYTGFASANFIDFTIHNEMPLGGIRFHTNSRNYSTDLNTPPMYILDNGNVGIGTNAPTRALHIHSNAQNHHALRITAGNQTDNWDIVKRGQSYAAGQNDNLVLSYNGNSAFNFRPNGFMGIGTAEPQAPLNVMGTVRLGQTTSNVYQNLQLATNVDYLGSPKGATVHSIFGPYNAALGSVGALYIGVGRSADNSLNDLIMYGTSGYNIRTTGIYSNQTGIATGSPGYTLDVNGTVGSFSGYTTYSDRYYKKDIQPLAPALNKVLQLKPVTYLLNYDADSTTAKVVNKDYSRQVGLIAQETREVFPTIVSTNTNGKLGIDYSKLGPILVQAVQELNAKIEAKPTAINNNDKINALEQELRLVKEKHNQELQLLLKRIEALEKK